ncbi:MAG: PKD domain-containing protein [Brumimicrobium sp.]|nr:PKD domain-containing protein [Brumimicrobium sp.]
MKNKTILRSIIFRFSVLFLFAALGISMGNSAKACHALALVNPSVTVQATGIQINASSDPATCGSGCNNSAYWLDIEIRCVGEPFNPAPFNPGFYGPLFTYPFFQSQQMQKPNCVLQAYPTTTISFGTLCPGNYQVRFRENHNGQVGAWSTPFNFNVPGVPTPISGTINSIRDTVCAGECIVLQGSVTGGCGLVPSYSWSTGSGNPQINVCPTQDSVFTVSITEICSGLTTTASKTIYVIPSPTPGTASADLSAVCSGETVQLSLNGYDPTAQIQWQSAPNSGGPWTDILGATADNITSPPITNTLKCFRVKVGNCGTPSYSNTVCITVNPVPTITASDLSLCQGETVDITTVTSPSGGTYYWEIDGSTNSSLDNLSPNITTDYIVHYSLNGCTAEDTATLTVYNQPVAGIIVDSVCLMNQTSFTDNTFLDNNGGNNIDTWEWHFGDGSTSSQQNPVHQYDSENVYDVELVVVTNYGCTDTAQTQTVVYPLPSVDFVVNDVCLNEESVFQNNTSVSNQNSNNSIIGYLWSFGDGNSSSDENPTHTYSSPGTFDVELTATTNNGCVDSQTIQTVVYPRPVVSLTDDTTIACSPLCFTLNSNSTIDAPSSLASYNWYVDGELVQQGPDFSYSDCIENNSGSTRMYDVELEVISDQGCTNNLLLADYLTVYHNPEASFEYSPEYLDVIETEVQFTNTSQFEDSIFWSFGTFETSVEQNPEIEFPAIAGDYLVTLLAITEEGCRDSVEVFINMDDRIIYFAPNSFTPDGDEFNQNWKIIFPDGFIPNDFKLLIYNRWGELVFESYDHQIGWNGFYGGANGKEAPTGTYVWKMEFKENQTDKRYMKTGHIILLR